MALDYEVYKLFEEMELELIRNMRRCLKSHEKQELKEGFKWVMWQAAKLRELKRYTNENREIVGKVNAFVTEETDKEMRMHYSEVANTVDN
jgi:hypothetical protein